MKMHPKQGTAYALARESLGMQELRGPMDNPEIVKMFADVGHEWVQDDETAWCAAFVGAMLKRAGLPHTGKLSARSYSDWGKGVNLADAQIGDVVTLWRESPSSWKGHVGFYAGTRSGQVLVLGGNQRDPSGGAVTIAPYDASRLLAVRRMPPPAADPSSTVDAPRAPAAVPGFIAWLSAIFGRRA